MNLKKFFNEAFAVDEHGVLHWNPNRPAHHFARQSMHEYFLKTWGGEPVGITLSWSGKPRVAFTIGNVKYHRRLVDVISLIDHRGPIVKRKSVKRTTGFNQVFKLMNGES